ncbi:hypothetical protein BRN55_00465, partial [Xanthomonas oryzae pv. oryzae]
MERMLAPLVISICNTARSSELIRFPPRLRGSGLLPSVIRLGRSASVMHRASIQLRKFCSFFGLVGAFLA